MDYYRADEIGKRSLSNLIQDNWSKNQSVGKGIKNAMSDKMKAFGKRVKSNFTGMNMIRKLTGSNVLAALYGKVTGKSKEDIAYFTGRKKPKTRRMSNIMSLPDSEGGISDKTISLLESMFSFMVQTETAKQRRAQTERSFREERDNEEQLRHNQFLKALSAFTGVGAATRVEEKKEGGNFLDMIKGLWDSFIAPYKWALDWLLTNKTLLLNIAKFFVGPFGLALLGGAAIVWLADQLKEYFRNNVPDMTVVSPSEAAAALSNGDQKQIDKLGGEAKLRDIISNAPKRATEILARGDNREILAAGGLEKLKQIQKDNITQPPKRDSMQDMSPSVAPRKVFAGTGLARKSKEQKWDREFGPYYDPDTGKRLEKPKLPETSSTPITEKTATPVQSATPAPEMKREPTAVPVQTTPPLGKINESVSENAALNLEQMTKPAGDSKPIVMQNSSSNNLKDSPISATATTRDETPILERVRSMSASPI
jgi:hypothetical protein